MPCHHWHDFLRHSRGRTWRLERWSFSLGALRQPSMLVSSAPMYIPVTVNAHSLPFLVDTGSAATLMSYDQWSSVCSSITLQPACPLVGVTSTPLHVAGTALLPLTINGISTHHLVHVAHGVNPSCILGRDFLSLHNCIINLATNSLSLHGATVPLTAGPAATPPGALSTSTSCPRRVGLTATTVIPPYHEMILPANVSPVLGCSIGIVEGDASFTDRCATDVARVLVSVTNDVIPVRLANFGPKPVTLYSGTHVGTFHPCDSSDVCAKPASTLPTGDQPVVAAVGSTDPSPTIDVDYVCNLDTNDAMSNSERQQLCQLLDQHHPVSSPTPKSCGQTSFIKHTIPTGSAPPIRQPHRRISPHLADTVRSELDAMLADDVIQYSWRQPCQAGGITTGAARSRSSATYSASASQLRVHNRTALSGECGGEYHTEVSVYRNDRFF